MQERYFGENSKQLHHWAFDVGWFTLQNDFKIKVSSQINLIPNDFERIVEFNFMRLFLNKKSKINLPDRKEIYLHQNAITWHRENKFYR